MSGTTARGAGTDSIKSACGKAGAMAKMMPAVASASRRAPPIILCLWPAHTVGFSSRDSI